MKNLLRVTLIANDKVVRETCSRIGIASRQEKILTPSCYLIERDGIYYLAHFKQLFVLSGEGYDNVSETDLLRRNAVAFCLKTWGLIDVVDEDIRPHDTFVFVLSAKDKTEWKINHKVNTYIYERDS